jgi:hypothetical protein
MTTGDDDEWPWASALPPVRPVYPFGDPGAPIELYSGPIAVDSVGPWDARIYADLAGDLQVRWSATRAEGWVDATDVDLTIEPPDASSNTVRAHRYRTSSDGEYVRVSGEIMDANVGSADAMCDRVIIHFTNLPRTSPADYLVDDGHYWAGRWACSGAGWRLILDVRQDHSKVWDAMRESLVFVVTHVGELRRADGSSFRASEAAEAMTAFQTGFSFALARWVAPVAPVGFDAAGNRVWEQWASWRCSPAFNYLPWWDSANGEDLKAFMELFLDAWLDPDRHEVTRHVARHLIVAHHRGTTIEAKIMLVHAALEYLAWVTYVLSGKCSRKKYREAPAEDHLRGLLKDAGIDPAIPSGVQALQRFAQEEQLADGPAALTRLRNRLVHPKYAGEPYHIEGLVTEAWRLSTEYGELLLLLGRIGYRGKYLPRTNMAQWVDSIPVPWTI